jgi:hypothetical protein
MLTNITTTFQTIGRPNGYSSSITTGGGLDVSGNLAITGLVSSKQKIWYSYGNNYGNATYTGTQIIGNYYSSNGNVYFSGHNYYNGANTGVWSSGDGEFTAPEDGVYKFFYYVFCNSTGSNARVNFTTNSSYFSYDQYGPFEYNSPSGEGTYSASYIANMNSGSKASLRVDYGSIIYFIAPTHTNLYVIKIA